MNQDVVNIKNKEHDSTGGEEHGQEQLLVAIYPTPTAAEAAIKELQKSGFDMKKPSFVGRDYHTDEHVVGYCNIGGRMASPSPPAGLTAGRYRSPKQASRASNGG